MFKTNTVRRCQRWVHKRCSGVNDSLRRAIESLNAVCLRTTYSEVNHDMNVGNGSSVESQRVWLSLFYLFIHETNSKHSLHNGHRKAQRVLLSVDGDADAAVTVSIRTGWFKFRSLVSFQRCFLVVARKSL